MTASLTPPPALPYDEVKATYFNGLNWTNMHRALHPSDMVGVIGRIVNDMQIVTGDFVNTISTCMPYADEIPEIHAVTRTESPSYAQRGFDGVLHEACLQLIGTGRFANRETQRWQRFARRDDRSVSLSNGLNTVMELSHSPALQLAKSVNDVMHEQGFLYIEGVPQDSERREDIRRMLEAQNYTIDGNKLRGTIRRDGGEAEEVALSVHSVSAGLKSDFIPGSGVDYKGNATDYQFGISTNGQISKPLGWIIDPQGGVVDENLATHWAIFNKLRSGGFYELNGPQQRMLFSGSFNAEKYDMGGFNGIRSTIAMLEQNHGLDMSTSALLREDPEGHSHMMAIIRSQLMNHKATLPNDLLLANAVAQTLCPVNPPDFDQLRPVQGEGRNAGADLTGIGTQNDHIRSVHPFKYASYDLQTDTFKQIAKTFGLELEDGTPLIASDDMLRAPQVTAGRDASILLGYGIIALEQTIIEQVLTRALEGDRACRETLDSIGEAVHSPDFAQRLLAAAENITRRDGVKHFGLGRQHENCRELTEIVRESLGLNELAKMMEHLVEREGIGEINREMHTALSNMWLASDRIHTLSSIPYPGQGMKAAFTPVVECLAPSLMPELETKSLGSERRNAPEMEYTPRIRGRNMGRDETASYARSYLDQQRGGGSAQAGLGH
ncbi:MAG TPA: hypothetical protein VFT64_12280 [Rickettsiales bacterium]|nr:hypothetical protein [Rickettsiales bacterium]